MATTSSFPRKMYSVYADAPLSVLILFHPLSWISRLPGIKTLVRRYYAWKRYEFGFSGHGTSVLDTPPGIPKPWLPNVIKEYLDFMAKVEAEIHKNAWRQACIETLGEDPEEDWIY